MKRFFLLLFVLACVAADVKHLTDRNIDLFKYDPSDVYTLPEDIDDEKPAVFFSGDVMKARVEKLQNLNGNKKFKLDLKTQNGIELTSVGKLKDEKTFVVSGSYSFTGGDGKRYKTRYTADELGYHPITELDLDIPEPQSQSVDILRTNDGNFLGSLKNRFQFLNQNFDGHDNPLRGSGQSGDDYSYSDQGNTQYESHKDSGYDYKPPSQPFGPPPSVPSRQYLPAQ